jgi:hypothetical protein
VAQAFSLCGTACKAVPPGTSSTDCYGVQCPVMKARMTALESPLRGAARLRLKGAMGYRICPPSPRPKVAEVTPGKYMPGKVGKR